MHTLPKPTEQLGHFPELPTDVQAAIEALSAPWPHDQIQIRPGATNREGTAAQALPFHDWWTGYLPRLNDELGLNNFRIRLEPWNNDVIAHLRAFGGLIEGWSSGSAKQDKLGPMEAEAQAKKRVCAEKLMLGLYLYYLPVVWMHGEYDRERRLFFPRSGEEQRCAYEMYARAGLIARPTPGITLPREQQPAPAAPTARHAAAVSALRAAEQHAGVAPASVGASAQTATPVSDAQLGLIAGLLNDLHTTADATAIDTLGLRFGLAQLSTLRSKELLCAQALTRLNASKLIDALKALTPAPSRAA